MDHQSLKIAQEHLGRIVPADQEPSAYRVGSHLRFCVGVGAASEVYDCPFDAALEVLSAAPNDLGWDGLRQRLDAAQEITTSTASECFILHREYPGTLGAAARLARPDGEVAQLPLEKADIAAFADRLKITDWPMDEFRGEGGDASRFADFLRATIPHLHDSAIPARHLVARFDGRLPVPVMTAAVAVAPPTGQTRIKFDDELTYAGTGGGSNRHRPRLVLQRGDELVDFAGKSIPGIVRVDADRYVKSGKWSHTKWDLTVAPGVIAWTQAGGSVRPLNVDGAPECRYHDVTRWAEVTAPEAVFRALAPLAAKRLDLNEIEV